MALGLLFVLKDFDPFRNTSRLALLLNRNSFDTLIDNFGGTTITIPTRDEVNSMLKSLVYYQARYVEHKSPYEAKRLSGADNNESAKIDNYVDKIATFFSMFDKSKLYTKKLKDVIDADALFKKQEDNY